jgi:hypothetical protein
MFAPAKICVLALNKPSIESGNCEFCESRTLRGHVLRTIWSDTRVCGQAFRG